MIFDFSALNLEYLIQARDLAMTDPELVAVMFGIDIEITRLLGQMTPKELALISLIRQPLVIPRQEPWWWSRLFNALRAGSPEEIAAAVVYLASEEAAYVTGQSLHVNGGMAMI